MKASLSPMPDMGGSSPNRSEKSEALQQKHFNANKSHGQKPSLLFGSPFRETILDKAKVRFEDRHHYNDIIR